LPVGEKEYLCVFFFCFFEFFFCKPERIAFGDRLGGSGADARNGLEPAFRAFEYLGGATAIANELLDEVWSYTRDEVQCEER
jgi:hypothetical protein